MALNSGIQTNQILTNDDEVCIPRVSSILLAVRTLLNLRPKKRRKKIGKFTVAKIRHFIEKPDDWLFHVAQHFLVYHN